MPPYGDIEIRSNSKFLKIESGTPHDIRLLSETPKIEVIHGFGQTKKSCTGEGCLYCMGDSEDAQPKQRFKTEVWDWKLQKKMEWEFGAAIAKQLQAIEKSLAEEGKKITEVDLKVQAEGANMQKKYTVTPRMTTKVLPPEAEIGF